MDLHFVSRWTRLFYNKATRPTKPPWLNQTASTFLTRYQSMDSLLWLRLLSDWLFIGTKEPGFTWSWPVFTKYVWCKAILIYIAFFIPLTEVCWSEYNEKTWPYRSPINNWLICRKTLLGEIYIAGLYCQYKIITRVANRLNTAHRRGFWFPD